MKRTISNEVHKAVHLLGGPTKVSHRYRVSDQTVHKWIRNGCVPQLSIAVEMSEAAGVDVDSIRPGYENVKRSAAVWMTSMAQTQHSAKASIPASAVSQIELVKQVIQAALNREQLWKSSGYEKDPAPESSPLNSLRVDPTWEAPGVIEARRRAALNSN